MISEISSALTTDKEKMVAARSFRLGPQLPPDRTRLAQVSGCLVVVRTIQYPFTPQAYSNRRRR
jgi:hypothetical protein